jgi:apolipoprotein N-acyltransferase
LGIASLVAYDGEMTPGSGPTNIEVKGAPRADPRVCYEIVFPNFNPKAAGNAGWILNVSIDAWYGDLLGPDQHYAQARARAIETGMPLVRAASGGWSAIVDRYGRPLAEHKAGAGYASARLPLDAKPTIYARYGEQIFLYLLSSLFIVMVISRKKNLDCV